MISIRSTTRLFAVALTTATALFASGCGGFSDEEAAARCDQERDARGEQGCFGAVEYDKCVVAYKECGNDVDIVDGCPPQFTCPDGIEETGETAETAE